MTGKTYSQLKKMVVHPPKCFHRQYLYTLEKGNKKHSAFKVLSQI
jgi:hypothetical protein